MMKRTLHILMLTLAAVIMNPAQAFDVAEGKQLVNENCNSCHGSELYTRDGRIVTSRTGLTSQVKRCEQALGLTWFDEDVDNAAEFLNQQYYRFAK